MELDQKAKSQIADLTLRKETYVQALAEVRATATMVREKLHDKHTLRGFDAVIRELELLINGCDAKVRRIETIGR